MKEAKCIRSKHIPKGFLVWII